jgi:hypothetical protein
VDTPLDAKEVGKELFGRPCRLALALWIVGHHKSRFYQSEPPREVILQGEVAKELRRLVRLGMLEELRPDDARRVYYDRTDSPLWKIIEAAADVVDPRWHRQPTASRSWCGASGDFAAGRACKR